MSAAWKCLFAVLSQLLPPLVNRRVGDTQFSGYLCNRLAAGLRQLHCLLFEFSCVNVLDLCHAKPSPDLLEYISALGALPNRGRLSTISRQKQEAGVTHCGISFC